MWHNVFGCYQTNYKADQDTPALPWRLIHASEPGLRVHEIAKILVEAIDRLDPFAGN
jgi:hypothetical protein